MQEFRLDRIKQIFTGLKAVSQGARRTYRAIWKARITVTADAFQPSTGSPSSSWSLLGLWSDLYFRTCGPP
jgi:hypothetical protein